MPRHQQHAFACFTPAHLQGLQAEPRGQYNFLQKVLLFAWPNCPLHFLELLSSRASRALLNFTDLLLCAWGLTCRRQPHFGLKQQPRVPSSQTASKVASQTAVRPQLQWQWLSPCVPPLQAQVLLESSAAGVLPGPAGCVDRHQCIMSCGTIERPIGQADARRAGV